MHSQELKAKAAFENGIFFLNSGNLKQADVSGL